ncbi:hypothetical protein L21SP2_0202 [Salinispira pacifica]|uniref:Uncharacterized protein n=1 Tax=Salinispira pacifica TaxID=1307761 RepID=V5WDK8_9SPIO|nr:hypothetical protein L21SP2_0202 [Salinispira pacifica]
MSGPAFGNSNYIRFTLSRQSSSAFFPVSEMTGVTKEKEGKLWIRTFGLQFAAGQRRFCSVWDYSAFCYPVSLCFRVSGG